MRAERHLLLDLAVSSSLARTSSDTLHQLHPLYSHTRPPRDPLALCINHLPLRGPVLSFVPVPVSGAHPRYGAQLGETAAIRKI